MSSAATASVIVAGAAPRFELAPETGEPLGAIALVPGGVAWVADGSDGAQEVLRAGPGMRPAVIGTFPAPAAVNGLGVRQEVTLSVSSAGLALSRYTAFYPGPDAARYNREEVAEADLLVKAGDRPFRSIVGCAVTLAAQRCGFDGAGTQCGPSAMDGDALAYAEGCPIAGNTRIVVRRVSDGNVLFTTVGDGPLALAGRYLAVARSTAPPAHPDASSDEVVLIDWTTGHDLLHVGGTWTVGRVGVSAAGVMTYAKTDRSSAVLRAGWTAASDPVPHTLKQSLGDGGYRLVGDEILSVDSFRRRHITIDRPAVQHHEALELPPGVLSPPLIDGRRLAFVARPCQASTIVLRTVHTAARRLPARLARRCPAPSFVPGRIAWDRGRRTLRVGLRCSRDRYLGCAGELRVVVADRGPNRRRVLVRAWPFSVGPSAERGVTTRTTKAGAAFLEAHPESRLLITAIARRNPLVHRPRAVARTIESLEPHDAEHPPHAPKPRV